PPAHVSVDEIDISPQLKRGRNAVGVIVYHLGVPSFPRMLGRAGLFAESSLGGERVVTDGSWKWREAWWTPSGQRYSIFREFTEILDARREPLGWSEPGFRDTDWKSATHIGPTGSPPWLNPEPRA